MGGRRREVAPKGGETGSDLPSDTLTSCPRACPVADGPEGDPGVDRAVGLLTCGADGLLGSAVRLLVYLALTTGLGQTVGMVAGTQGPVAATAHTRALGRGWESCASPPRLRGGLSSHQAGCLAQWCTAGRFSVGLLHGEEGRHQVTLQHGIVGAFGFCAEWVREADIWIVCVSTGSGLWLMLLPDQIFCDGRGYIRHLEGTVPPATSAGLATSQHVR